MKISQTKPPMSQNIERRSTAKLPGNLRSRRPSKKHDVDDVKTGNSQQDNAAIPESKKGFEFWSNRQQVITLHVITVLLRLWVVSSPSSWWVLHPDEVYQSIEVAHSEVYGYGFRPYEFLPAPQTDNRTQTTRAERQEAALGMYSMRSYIYPSLYMGIFHVCHMAGLQSSPVMIAKLFHGFVASHLSLAVYYFTLVVGRSHEAAILAAILITFSEHLTTFATHTIICSFLSPFVFGILALQMKWICDKRDEVDITGDFNDDEKTSVSEDNINGVCNTNGHLHKENGLLTSVECDHFTKTNGAINKTHTLVNQTGLEAFVKLSFIGFVKTVLCYIRPDLVVLFLVINATYLRPQRFIKFVSHIGVWTGTLVALLVCGYSDKSVYGVWFMSPLQWIKFNVLSKTSSLLFGEEHSTWYFYKILNSSVMFQAQLIIVTVGLAGMAFQVLSSTKPRSKCQPTIDMLLTVVILFTVYSLKDHKEMRFLHNTIVFLHILSSLVVWRFITESNHIHKDSGATFKLSITMLTVLLASNIYNHQKFGLDISDTQQSWLYKEASDSGHVNVCLDFIGRQNDVNGLFLDYCIHTTMGYSIIHKDIPVLTLVHDEFYEFDKSVKRLIKSHDLFGKRRNIAVYTFSNPANFITRENYPLLLKYILENPKYNYVIYGSSLSVELSGFNEIFSSGPFTVFRRQENPDLDTLFQRVASEMDKNLNSTLLTYEGGWLLTFEQYRRACERLQLAADVEVTPAVKTLQLLYFAHQKMGNKEKALEVYKNCTRLHGVKACNQPQPKIKLRNYENLDALKKSLDMDTS